jgi:site-specific recombinase XerD
LAKASINQSAVVKYENTRSRLMEFIPQCCNTKDIAIKDVNYDFITGFDTFLRTTYNCRHNTVVKYLRYLKQVTTEAIKSGLICIDPFMDIKLSSKKGNRKYLTKEELKTIMSGNFVSETLTEARDIFVFGCFTGFAYVDISKLTKDDIIEGENNQKFIIKDRTKTSVESFVPLFDTPLKIISKYEKLNLSGNKLFPVSACQVYNRYLKEIAALCDITKTLSSHVARHTFATLMLTEGISVESVSKMLGHTDIRTTQIYARILNEKVISETSQKKPDIDSLSDSWHE